jgi:integrase
MSDTYPKSADLTDQLVRRLPFTARGQVKIRDEECKGLLLVIGMETKTFSAKVERMVSGLREFGYESFGRFDPEAPDHVSVKDARKAARKWIAEYRNGAKVAVKRGGTTLREAWARYKARLEAKDRSPRTIEWYRENIEDGPLKEWLDTQLVFITPEKVAALHTHVTRKNGASRANGAMRTLRAVYNYAKRKVDRALPQLDVTMLVEWNAEKRRKTGMGLGRLPAWGRQLAALENPVRREFHLMSLLSGSRPDALSKAEWSHVSVARRVLHIPAPKGGEERAFDIPLSRPMLYCLVRARRAGRILHREQAQRFIFPALSEEGHLVDWREHREVLSKFGTDLRQSFKTMIVECGVGKLEAKILMNHKVDQDVHDGYATTPELREHLHNCQARISAGMMARLVPAMGPALRISTDITSTLASANRVRVARIRRMAPLLQHVG